MRLLRDKPLVCVSPSVDPRSSNGLEECVCRFTPVRLEIASVAPVCMVRLLLVGVCVTRAIALGERLISLLIKSSNGVHVGVREPLDLPEVERALPFFSSYGCGLVECVCRFTPVRLEIASVAPVCMVRLLLVGVRVTRTLPLVESHVSLFLPLWLGRVCVTRAI